MPETELHRIIEKYSAMCTYNISKLLPEEKSRRSIRNSPQTHLEGVFLKILIHIKIDRERGWAFLFLHAYVQHSRETIQSSSGRFVFYPSLFSLLVSLLRCTINEHVACTRRVLYLCALFIVRRLDNQPLPFGPVIGSPESANFVPDSPPTRKSLRQLRTEALGN